MRKFSVLSMVFLLVASALCAEVVVQEIECELKPIDRSKIHPNGNQALFVPASTSQSSSTNWSGYVAATDLTGTSGNDMVTDVAGSWVVPTLVATTDATYCAIWVGIDGYSSESVEQIGTSHNWSNGAQQNYAWYEMYPSGSYEISGFPVDNGDVISAKVAYEGNNTFKLVISNLTKKISTTIPTSQTMSSSAARSSAEWIVEAPYSGEILPLSDFKAVTLNYCSAVIDGVKGAINNGKWFNDEITMAGQKGVEAQPSSLLKNGTCFHVAWESQ